MQFSDKNKSLVVCFAIFGTMLNVAIAATKLDAKAVDFKCEYLKNPLGIDNAHPRLTWKMANSKKGAKQSAFQIIVSTDSLAIVNRNGTVWDSEKTVSGENLAVFKGKRLQPFTKYYWTVDIWNEADKKLTSKEVASFETGMMEVSNWKGAWITDVQDINLKPAPYFRTAFQAKKRIKSARAYIAVGGLFELSINGKKIGNHRLDPAFTRYDRRILYVTHDVTSQIKQNANVVGVLLGNGWYNHQSTAVWGFDKASWRGRPTFCMDIRITYEDGSVETIVTGEQWKTSLSPIIFNSIYTAEHYDARLEQPGWNTVGFDDRNWKSVILSKAPAPQITAQAMQPIRNVQKIEPATVKKLNDTTYVYNLGRNISGVSKITLNGSVGTIIKLKHGERLYENGRVDISNIDYHFRPTDDSDPFQTDIFILGGKGNESFMPRFNYKGFQYVEVTSSKPITLNINSLSGYFMHSDVPSVGKVNSSNPLINKIWEATNNSYLSNLFGYPTDCPQREKNGWTGDAHIAIETGLYNFDGITVYEKWLADHRDEQQPNGVLPAIIPTADWGYSWANGLDWTSSIAIIPWNLYLFYGDEKVLVDNYEAIKRYVDHVGDLTNTGLTNWGLGDWVPVKSKSSIEFTSSTYYFIDAQILANVAQILGHKADHQKYKLLAEKIKAAINNKFLNKETGIYASGLQTELSFALYWKLAPEELKDKVAKNLADRVVADNFKIDVGLLGTKTILNALSENGYADVAYKMASQETYPSWGWWIKNGATTLYENWDIAATKDISLNHIMFGEISAWFYKALGGIKPDPKQPGFKHILLKPHFVNNLNHFKAEYESPYGKIISSWEKKKGTIIYKVTIPPNTTGSLLFPESENKKLYQNGSRYRDSEFVKLQLKSGRKTYHLESGSYQFELK